MSSANFTKYMTFLNWADHTLNESTLKKMGSAGKISIKNRRSSNFPRPIEHESLTKFQSEKNSSARVLNDDPHHFPRSKTNRKSIITGQNEKQNENANFMEKMFPIAQKVMKNLKKLENLNNNNKNKTYIELFKLFNNNVFLKEIFFDSSGKEMNPKLSESFIANSVVIYPSKFNKNPLENKIKYNYEGKKVLEKLSEKIKEFCFNKKLLKLQAEENDIVDLQKALKNMENKSVMKPTRSPRRGLHTYSTNVEMQPKFNSQISKMIKNFEERHGPLGLIKEKSKIVGERIDHMLQDIYEKFLEINNKV